MKLVIKDKNVQNWNGNPMTMLLFRLPGKLTIEDGDLKMSGILEVKVYFDSLENFYLLTEDEFIEILNNIETDKISVELMAEYPLTSDYFDILEIDDLISIANIIRILIDKFQELISGLPENHINQKYYRLKLKILSAARVITDIHLINI